MLIWRPSKCLHLHLLPFFFLLHLLSYVLQSQWTHMSLCMCVFVCVCMCTCISVCICKCIIFMEGRHVFVVHEICKQNNLHEVPRISWAHFLDNLGCFLRIRTFAIYSSYTHWKKINMHMYLTLLLWSSHITHRGGLWLIRERAMTHLPLAFVASCPDYSCKACKRHTRMLVCFRFWEQWVEGGGVC